MPSDNEKENEIDIREGERNMTEPTAPGLYAISKIENYRWYAETVGAMRGCFWRMKYQTNAEEVRD